MIMVVEWHGRVTDDSPKNIPKKLLYNVGSRDPSLGPGTQVWIRKIDQNPKDAKQSKMISLVSMFEWGWYLCL